MAALDVAEHRRWVETARDHLEVARRVHDAGYHAHAVLLAEQSVQCALKALLHGVGATEQARSHDLVTLADRCRQMAALPVDDGLRSTLRRLALTYLPSRYPDAVPGGATPAQAFDADQAATAIAVAERVSTLAEAAWQALLESEEEA